MCEKRYATPFQSTRHSNQAYEFPTPVYIVFHSSLLIAETQTQIEILMIGFRQLITQPGTSNYFDLTLTSGSYNVR